jgi:hypothetical protein
MEQAKWSRLIMAVVLLAGSALSAQAQVARVSHPDWRTTQVTGVGYMGNAPHALIGAMAYVITPALGGFGVFADGRFTHRNFEADALFEPGITAAQAEGVYGDQYVQTVESWRAGHVGVVRPLTPDFGLYAGLGYARGSMYREYYDETVVRGNNGSYRARDEAESGGKLSLTGGALFRFGSSLAFQFGLDSAPRGFTAGASLLFQ